MRIVETDNFGSDYPDEQFVNLPSMRRDFAENIAREINMAFPSQYPRYWIVVDDDYVLQGGFEP